MGDHFVTGDFAVKLKHVPGEQNRAQNPSRDECDPGISSSSSHQFDPYAYYYDMSKGRLMFIFNHENFRNESLCQRKGTDRDAQELAKTFGQLGFEVDNTSKDLTHAGILDKLNEICEKTTNISCLVIAILTYAGDTEGKVYAADKEYSLTDVINYIMNEKSLAGIPKLFVIQASRCRADGVETDGGRAGYTIPTFADCLVVMSPIDDVESFQNNSGTRIIQTLCDVLNDEQSQELHILDVITLMNERLDTISQSNNLNGQENQIPETKYTLTKMLKF